MKRLSLKHAESVAVALAILLRIGEYLANRTFTWDESAVALSIMREPYLALTQLLYLQYRPFLFSVAVKALTSTFSTSELTFRFIPLIAGIISVILFYNLSKKILDKRFVWVSVAIFGLSTSLISYSSFLREYSIDVLLYILFYLLLGNYIVVKKALDIKTVLLIGVLGTAAVWLSNPIYFLLATGGAIVQIYFLIRKDYGNFFKFMIPIALWGLGMILNYLIVLRHFSGDNLTLQYFTLDGSFPPSPIYSILAIKWFYDSFVYLLSFHLGSIFIPPLIFFLLGVYALFKKNRLLLFLLISPIVFAFCLSTVKLYPVTGRHMLFAAPMLIVIITAGISKVYEIVKRKMVLVAIFLILLAALFGSEIVSAYKLASLPEEQDNLKTLMTYVRDHKKTGDWIYLYNNTNTPYIYYAPRLGLANLPYIEGRLRTQAFVTYLDDFKTLIGKDRVWVIFTHDYNWGLVDEQAYIVTYLDKIGKRITYYPAGSSALFLYDLRPSSK